MAMLNNQMVNVDMLKPWSCFEQIWSVRTKKRLRTYFLMVFFAHFNGKNHGFDGFHGFLPCEFPCFFSMFVMVSGMVTHEILMGFSHEIHGNIA